MEKPADLNSRDEPAPLHQQQNGDWRQPHADEEIRRQLGWGLVACERKGALR